MSSQARLALRPTRPRPQPLHRPHVFATRLALGFTLLFGVAAALGGGRLLRFSTLESFERPSWPALAAHVVGTVGWALTSANLTIRGFHRWHRAIGYAAFGCCVLMSCSAYHLSLQGCVGVGLLHHATFHAFSNMQVAGILPLLLGFAIGAASAGEHKEHQRHMASAHVLVAANFLPRGAPREQGRGGGEQGRQAGGDLPACSALLLIASRRAR